MNKLPLLILMMLAQGCIAWERKWDLGICKESTTGLYGCTVKIPKYLAGVKLSAQMEPLKDGQTVPSADLKIRLHNKESRTIQIQGDWNVDLKPGEDFVVLAKRGAGGWAIGFFDTSEGATHLRVDILDGKPAGTAIRILAHSSGGL